MYAIPLEPKRDKAPFLTYAKRMRRRKAKESVHSEMKNPLLRTHLAKKARTSWIDSISDPAVGQKIGPLPSTTQEVMERNCKVPKNGSLGKTTGGAHRVTDLLVLVIPPLFEIRRGLKEQRVGLTMKEEVSRMGTERVPIDLPVLENMGRKKVILQAREEMEATLKEDPSPLLRNPGHPPSQVQDIKHRMPHLARKKSNPFLQTNRWAFV
jgi:hypothetical protein